MSLDVFATPEKLCRRVPLDFFAEIEDPRGPWRVTPHVAQNTKGRWSAIDGRTTRDTGYAVSLCIHKRIEEAFGWIKAVARHDKTRFRGVAPVGFAFTLAAAACDLVRLLKLLVPA